MHVSADAVNVRRRWLLRTWRTLCQQLHALGCDIKCGRLALGQGSSCWHLTPFAKVYRGLQRATAGNPALLSILLTVEDLVGVGGKEPPAKPEWMGKGRGAGLRVTVAGARIPHLGVVCRGVSCHAVVAEYSKSLTNLLTWR